MCNFHAASQGGTKTFYSVVCPCLHVFNNQRLSILCFSEYSCLGFSTPCNFVPLFPFLAVSTPAFWDILAPLFPFPLFHVSHFQRPRSAPFLGRGAGFPSIIKSPGPRPSSLPSGILIQPFGRNRYGPKIGGYAPLGEGELGPHLTQCRL